MHTALRHSKWLEVFLMVKGVSGLTALTNSRTSDVLCTALRPMATSEGNSFRVCQSYHEQLVAECSHGSHAWQKNGRTMPQLLKKTDLTQEELRKSACYFNSTRSACSTCRTAQKTFLLSGHHTGICSRPTTTTHHAI